ncbi:MAG: hypothetical protein ACLFP2_06060 [Candidatus Woesearchaeota archaeon]
MEDVHEEISPEEMIEENNAILNAVIDLLVEKEIISEEELQKKLEEE